MADCLTEQNSLINNQLSNDLDINNSLHSTDSINQSFQLFSHIPNFKYNKPNPFTYLFHKIQSIILYFQEEKFNYYNFFSFLIFSIFIIFILVNTRLFGKRNSILYDDYRYKIEIIKYDILYDINNDSSMNITENITISYQGTENTGFRRLIPVNNGVQIRKIRIGQIIENRIEKIYHKEYFEEGNLVLDIGDYELKCGKNESYFITYEFRILNKKIEKENLMSLNVIGYEWKSKINNAHVDLIIPSGFTEAICYENHQKSDKFNVTDKNVKKIISAFFKFLNEFEGVTFDLYFTPKSIKSYVDSYPVYYVKITFVTLIIIIMIGFAFYQNYNKVSPVRYTSALNTMDPLIMSKVLNGSVKKSDVTSIIFYWASEGYLDINFDNENDPILIKNDDSIPDSFPLYQTYMFNELFKNKNIVKSSDLKFKFYKTINNVIHMVDSQTTRFVNVKSIAFSAFFAVFGVIWSFYAPFNLIKCVSEEFDFSSSIFVFLFIAQAIIWILRYSMTYKYLMNTDYYCLWLFVGIISLIYLCFYIDFIPSFIISKSYKFILVASSLLCVISSVSLITKTNYFIAKIGEVFGFKQFIEHPINEEFDSFIKKDPELFYNLLCYAQVLGVTDKWKHKFDNLTATPPRWMRHSDYDRFYYGDFNMINHRIAISRTRMFHNLVVSPHQNRSSGHRSSHSSHSHGGHGFGGGGGHGR